MNTIIKRIRRRHHKKKPPIIDGGCECEKKNLVLGGKLHQSVSIVDDEEFDGSAHTADMDASLSYRSGNNLFTDHHHQYSSSTRKLSSCMKVATQRESLISISSTATPTITEAIFEDSDTDLNDVNTTVQFDTVAFREYTSIEISDNPSTVGIGWRYDPKDKVIDLEEYEKSVQDTRRTTRAELAIPAQDRAAILKEAGFSRHEISRVEQEALKEKRRRNSSVLIMKFDPITERVDLIKRRLSSRKSSDLYTPSTPVNTILSKRRDSDLFPLRNMSCNDVDELDVTRSRRYSAPQLKGYYCSSGQSTESELARAA